MLLTLLNILIIVIITYLILAEAYQLFLAVCFFLIKQPKILETNNKKKFAIIVPAYNEELLVPILCKNLESIKYPRDLYDVFIIADNCSDRTAEICSAYPVIVLSRFDRTKIGKGYALEWALRKIDLESYDAVLILDADTTVDPHILKELNKMLNNGEQAIQCLIEMPNKHESWFASLISLSRTINTFLYHDSKRKLGLSSYLMGTGMCFTSDLLKSCKWNAFTLSEDFEYYTRLVERGIKIAFASNAVIFQLESKSLGQATSQRLRWASGRFNIAKKLGLKLLIKGLREKSVIITDASLILLFPNLSLQLNLIVLVTFLSMLLPFSSLKLMFLRICLGLIATQSLIILMGAYLSRDLMVLVRAALFTPIFLVWKSVIDFLCITKVYKGEKWIRTNRHAPKI